MGTPLFGEGETASGVFAGAKSVERKKSKPANKEMRKTLIFQPHLLIFWKGFRKKSITLFVCGRKILKGEVKENDEKSSE